MIRPGSKVKIVLTEAHEFMDRPQWLSHLKDAMARQPLVADVISCIKNKGQEVFGWRLFAPERPEHGWWVPTAWLQVVEDKKPCDCPLNLILRSGCQVLEHE